MRSKDKILILVGSTDHAADGHAAPSNGVPSRVAECNVANVGENWRQTIQQLTAIAAPLLATPPAGGLVVDEITVGLGLTVEGDLAFIARAGDPGTVQVRLKRA
jgi:hypothetical protein